MKKGLLVIGLAASLSCGSVFADWENTGNELMRQCAVGLKWLNDPESITQTMDFVSMTACSEYIRGVGGAMNAASVACVPSSVEVGQLVRIVSNYGREHPLILDKSKLALAGLAIQSAYPCSAGANK